MRIRRSTLKDSGRGQYFHVTSRVVERRFIFGEREKEYFLRIIRQYEGFTGVQVMSYCLMSNHFHLLIHVPGRPESIPEDEVIRRMRCLYKKEQIEEFRERLEEFNNDIHQRFREEMLDKVRVRMYDLSHFVRELKLRFSKYYNSLNDRKGTLWEERFKCSLIEGDPNALMNTAAYIELNPVRAGIVDDPKDYRWCSYTESIAGGKSARMGIIHLASGRNAPLKYKEAMARYRQFFMYKSQSQQGSRRSMTKVSGSIESGSGSRFLSKTEAIFVKVRYFLDGVVLGSREFIEDWHKRNLSVLNASRKKISSPIQDPHMEGLHTYRKVE